MTTEEIFRNHNQELLKNLIPDDKEMPVAYFFIDPREIIFEKSFKEIINETKQTNHE